jgi:hypothetical protein
MRKALLLPLLFCLLGASPLAAQEPAPPDPKPPLGYAPPDAIVPIPLGTTRPEDSAFIIGAALVLDTNAVPYPNQPDLTFAQLAGPGLRLHAGRKFSDGSCLHASWMRRCAMGWDDFRADYTTTVWESEYTRLRLRIGADGSTGRRSPSAGPQLALEGELYLGNGIAVHVTLGATLVLGDEEGPRLEWEVKLGAVWYLHDCVAVMLEYDLAQGYWLAGIELAI